MGTALLALCLSLSAGAPREGRPAVAADEPERVDDEGGRPASRPATLRADDVLRVARALFRGVMNARHLKVRPVQAPVDEPPQAEGRKKKPVEEGDEDEGLPTIAWVAIIAAIVAGGAVLGVLGLAFLAALLAVAATVALALVLLIIYVIVAALSAAGANCVNSCCGSLFSGVDLCSGCSAPSCSTPSCGL